MQIVKAYDMAHEAQLPELFNPGQLATPERRAQAQKIAMVMEAWCSSVRKYNLEFAKEGGEIPGYGSRVAAQADYCLPERDHSLGLFGSDGIGRIRKFD